MIFSGRPPPPPYQLVHMRDGYKKSLIDPIAKVLQSCLTNNLLESCRKKRRCRHFIKLLKEYYNN